MHHELLTLSAGVLVHGRTTTERNSQCDDDGNSISPEDFHAAF